MKMSEVFTGGKVVKIGGYHDNDTYINTENHGFGIDEEGVADAAILAINNHDALVEALECIISIAELKTRGNDSSVKRGINLIGEPMYYKVTLSSITKAKDTLKKAKGES